MDDFSTAPAIVALAGAGLGLIALVWAASLSMRMRRLRQAQRVVLGDGEADLVGHAAELQHAFEALRAGVEASTARIDGRLGVAEHRLDGCVAYRALVRYDAYGELSGHQSATIALLDAEHNGVVLSSIAHRESARMYCKQVVAGKGDVELSPEELEAVRLALAGEISARTLD
jgi:hypothetical protein